MEASTTIQKMMAGNKISVPSYQRAYSWDTPVKGRQFTTQTDVFLSDLEEHINNKSASPYYFGHFLFEERNGFFHVIDGQQRLTTIVIFLRALFLEIEKHRSLKENEEICFEDMIRRKSLVRFSTVDYDNRFFLDYVINRTRGDCNNLDTESSRRIARAFDYFENKLKSKPKEHLTQMLTVISKATCTTHPVKHASEAIQMFIFQNNRGKRPSNLEIVKAQFMYVVHLQGGRECKTIINEIKDRFEKIYKSISSIEYHISEDDVLFYTLQVYFNSLSEDNSLEKIYNRLSQKDAIQFIRPFADMLSKNFEYLTEFFVKDESKYFAIHSLISLTRIGIALPFIIKAYSFDLSCKEIEKLCVAMESLILRHRLIGTRAELRSRINDVFMEFTKEIPKIAPIISRIDWLKSTGADSSWWAYWNNERLAAALQEEINSPLAKFLLWKYETYLEGNGKSGYSPSRFDKIISPELEHISPVTEPPNRSHGYNAYNEKFKNSFLNCLGNYLLLSKSHNCAVGNIPFQDKIATYTHNEQQREVKAIGLEHKVWKIQQIKERQERIIEVLLNIF